MQNNNNNPFQRSGRVKLIFVAFGFIAAGVLQLGYNAGWIPYYWYHILLSWPMILVLVGFACFLQWKIGQGVALWATAAFFLLPRITGEEYDNLWQYWPVFLIIGGVGMLLDLVFFPKKRHCKHGQGGDGDVREEEGYVYANSSFYSLRHTVTAPVFKGARLEASFGSLTLDLRHTHLEAAETYIDISNSFAGIELYVPSSWNVVIDAHTSFGGLDDKRFMGYEIDYSHKLVVRGNNSFGGVEIKS